MGQLLDKLAARLGYARKRYSRGYPAAGLGRLTNDWTASRVSADAQARVDLAVLQARCRDLRQKNDYAKRFIQMVADNVVGEGGIALEMKVKEMDTVVGNVLNVGRPDVFANKQIRDAWRRWGKKEFCTPAGRQTWREVQRMAIKTIGTDGELLVRKIRDPENPYNFSVQLIEADYLDHRLNRTQGNNQIRMGVEIDSMRKPVAYWLHRTNPSESIYGFQSDTLHDRIPASEVIHPFLAERPEQTRGLPWMATAAMRMQMLHGYEESEAVAARVAAAKMGVIKTTGAIEYDGSVEVPEMSVEPGSFEQLPQGLELQPWDPQHPTTQYAAFVKGCLRGIAAGLGVAYHTLANDLEGVNFSSGRLGAMDERSFWMNLQSWFIDCFVTPIFEEWLSWQLMNGSLGLPSNKFEKFNAPTWRARRWTYVDPQKEINANAQAIEMGLTSRARVLSEQSVDWEDVMAELAAEKQLAEQLGISVNAKGNGSNAGANTIQDAGPEPGNAGQGTEQD